MVDNVHQTPFCRSEPDSFPRDQPAKKTASPNSVAPCATRGEKPKKSEDCLLMTTWTGSARILERNELCSRKLRKGLPKSRSATAQKCITNGCRPLFYIADFNIENPNCSLYEISGFFCKLLLVKLFYLATAIASPNSIDNTFDTPSAPIVTP